jgi:hydrogenase-4 component F
MVVIITLLAAIAALYGVGYMRAACGDTHLPRVRSFFALFQVFIFTMLLAVTTDNLGIMWVAIEGTTLATVFLVNLHNTRTSIEAAYKYLILSSVGIALAFIGTALMYYAGASRAGEIAVNWTSLHAAASSLNPQVVRLYPRRLWDEGRPGADAHVVAGCPQRSARSD